MLEEITDIWLTANSLPSGSKCGKDEWKEKVSGERNRRGMAVQTAPLPPNNGDHPHSSTSLFTQPGSQGVRDEITRRG